MIIKRFRKPIANCKVLVSSDFKIHCTFFRKGLAIFSHSSFSFDFPVDLVMWKEVPRSALILLIGSFIILSSSYTRDVNLRFENLHRRKKF